MDQEPYHKNQCLPWFAIKWIARWCPISWRICKRSPTVLFFCAQDQSNSLVPLLPWSTYFSMWRTSSQVFESRSAVEMQQEEPKNSSRYWNIWCALCVLFNFVYSFYFELTLVPHPASPNFNILHNHSPIISDDLILISSVFLLSFFSSKIPSSFPHYN